jgi:hypothetical protein
VRALWAELHSESIGDLCIASEIRAKLFSRAKFSLRETFSSAGKEEVHQNGPGAKSQSGEF